MMNLLRPFLQDQQGNVAVIFGVALVPLLGMSGMALDYSRASTQRTDMRAALDAALLAAAQEKVPANREPRARNVYDASITPAGRKNEKLTIWVDTASNTLHGRAEADVPVTLASVFTHSPAKVSTESAVSLNNNPVCLLLLAPTGVGLDMGSSGEIRMPGCEVDVKSKSKPAVTMSSTAAVNSALLCAEGAISAALMNSTYQQGCRTIDDQWGKLMPSMVADPSCTYSNKVYNNNNAPTALTPGNICNGMTFNSSVTITFAPGLYRVRGGPITFKAASRIIAAGVTFYFEDEKSMLVMSANSQMEITPPTSGPYKGIAMFEPPNLPQSSMDFVCAANNQTNGIYYLPSRNLTFNSSASFAARTMNVVAYTAKFTSSSTWVVDPIPDAVQQAYHTDIHLTQ
jgi:Flp pilus assembly protein TadG